VNEQKVNYLLEIGVEELPTSMVRSIFQQMEQAFTAALENERIEHEGVEVTGTPRRIVVLVYGAGYFQEPRISEIKGPAKKAGVAENGEFLQPALAFARSQGIDPGNLYVSETDKGWYVFGKKSEPGKPLRNLLPSLLPQIVTSLSFSRSMTWGKGDFRFVRPIRWVLSLLGNQVVPFYLCGIEAGRTSRGHRFLSSGELQVASVEAYLPLMEEAGVVVSAHKRRSYIEKALEREARRSGAHWLRDENLIEEVTFLVEFPDAARGRFDRMFLELPSRVLTTVMKHHQKYFALVDDTGELLPDFLVVLNRPVEGAEKVVRGNERVLRARLEDARFFYTEDRKKNLSERIDDLKGIMYQENLGTMWEKTLRLQNICAYLGKNLHFSPERMEFLDTAAHLAKTDLTCELVKEFPELKGYMGREYLAEEGEAEEVCIALEDQYLPAPGGKQYPETQVGCVLSLADKMDHIVSSFALGRIPSGSVDPLGLRRQAHAMVALLLERRWYISLGEFSRKNLELLSLQGFLSPETDVADTVVEFIVSRFRTYLQEAGFHYSLVNSVLHTGIDDITEAYLRIAFLQELYDKQRDLLISIFTAFTRANNISKSQSGESKIQDEYLKEPAEKELAAKITRFERDFLRALGGGDFQRALESFEPVIPALNRFFDDVLIMCPDEVLKENRLSMMKKIVDVWRKFADLSLVVVPEGMP